MGQAPGTARRVAVAVMGDAACDKLDLRHDCLVTAVMSGLKFRSCIRCMKPCEGGELLWTPETAQSGIVLGLPHTIPLRPGYLRRNSVVRRHPSRLQPSRFYDHDMADSDAVGTRFPNLLILRAPARNWRVHWVLHLQQNSITPPHSARDLLSTFFTKFGNPRLPRTSSKTK